MTRDEVLAAARDFAAHRVATRAQIDAQLKALAELEIAEIEAAAEKLGPRRYGTVAGLAEAFGRSRNFVNEVILNRWGPANAASPASCQTASEELPATA